MKFKSRKRRLKVCLSLTLIMICVLVVNVVFDIPKAFKSYAKDLVVETSQVSTINEDSLPFNNEFILKEKTSGTSLITEEKITNTKEVKSKVIEEKNKNAKKGKIRNKNTKTKKQQKRTNNSDKKDSESGVGKYVTKEVPVSGKFKSWMDFRTLTSKTSPQYLMQNRVAYTGKYGIRMVDNRYCIAVGSYYVSNIGTYIDLVMSNGEVIKCVLADQKANKDTDPTNRYHRCDGSVVEFIVDIDYLDRSARRMGDVSAIGNPFSGSIKDIKVYNKKADF